MEKHTSKSLTKFTDPDLDSSTIAFLNESTRQIMNVVSNSATQIGKILYGAQQKLASFNNNGAFAKWIEYIGFGRTSAYNYINRYIAVQNLESDKEIQAFESLPKSLTYDISKPSADPELTKKVLDGKIKTHKEYKALEAKLKQREQELSNKDAQIADQQAELEDNRKTQLEMSRQIAESNKRQPEPKVITKTVTKEVPVKPDDYDDIKAKLDELKKQSAKDKEDIDYYKRELKAAERINKDANGYDKLQEQELKRKKRQAQIFVYDLSLDINDFLNEHNIMGKGLQTDRLDDEDKQALLNSTDAMQRFIDEIKNQLNNDRIIQEGEVIDNG